MTLVIAITTGPGPALVRLLLLPRSHGWEILEEKKSSKKNPGFPGINVIEDCVGSNRRDEE